MSDKYLNNLLQLRADVAEFFDELSLYIEKGIVNASHAQRLRKQSTALGHQLKDFRADSVQHHRKA